MIVIKGSHVRFELVEPSGKPVPHPNPGKVIKGKIVTLPTDHGIIHDPDGQAFDRCEVFFGPYRKTRRRAEMTKAARAYMGSDYPASYAVVDLPRGTWKPLGEVAQIFYKRPGRYDGKYFHPFKRGHAPHLFKCGRFYKLALPGGCIVDDRGFVFP